jgi:hypothetical protein
MDLLAKYDLIERGAVSWLEYAYPNEILKENMLTSVSRGYKYKYWVPRIKNLTEVVPSPDLNYYSVPKEYKQSFIQLVVESRDKDHVVSEKSLMPLFYKKPFIVLAAQYHHALLQDYGFQLYDEYFDYSFDKDPDLNNRAEAIAKNILKVVNLSPAEQQEVHKLLMPKLEYNYNLAMSLATDRTLLPEIILEGFADPNNVYCSGHLKEMFVK